MNSYRYYIRCSHDNSICGDYESTIGRTNSLKTAKQIIKNTKKDSGVFENPYNFEVYDVWTSSLIYKEN